MLPVIGTKELIAWLPTLLGLGAEDVVVVPELAYPTYDVGARLAGAQVLRADSLTQLGPAVPGPVVPELAEQPDRAGARRRPPAQGRRLGARARCRGGLRRVLPGLGLGRRAAVGAASRRSATATTPVCWRCTRCPRARRWPVTGPVSSPAIAALVAELLAVRKHAGMMVPTPVQAAMVAALDDDAHEREQRERYARRRDVLLPAFRSAGFTVDHSEAGLYLWVTRGEPAATASPGWRARHSGGARRVLRPARRPACPGGADRHRRAHRRRRAAAHAADRGPCLPRAG